jgi:hypothetical protein
MNRRVWIKQTMIVGGAIMILPACMQDKGAVSVGLKNIAITGKDERLFAEITEMIIPETTTLGAKSLNLHQFVLKMFDDCYDQKQQDAIVSGLKQFDSFAKTHAGDQFTALNGDQKLEVLRAIAQTKPINNELRYFLNETRIWTMKGYLTSKYVLTEINHYEMVPGRFHGCVTINKAHT